MRKPSLVSQFAHDAADLLDGGKSGGDERQAQLEQLENYDAYVQGLEKKAQQAEKAYFAAAETGFPARAWRSAGSRCSSPASS